MSRQSFEHTVLQMHSVMLHIKQMGKTCPSQPSDLEETGSDPCERSFANFGGHGLIGGGWGSCERAATSRCPSAHL